MKEELERGGKEVKEEGGSEGGGTKVQKEG